MAFEALPPLRLAEATEVTEIYAVWSRLNRSLFA